MSPTEPTQTASPPVEVLPEMTPFPTSASKLPLAQIRILRPGQLSKVTSPFFMETSVIPGANGIVRIELTGEDGRVLTRQVLGFATPHGQRVGINPKITFEISGVSEAARLQVSVEDGYHRTIALSAVDLILLTVGQAEVNPAGDLVEPYVVVSPKPDEKISGGTLSISGLARPVNDKPLSLDLLDNEGKILGSRQILVQGSEDGSHTPFQTTIPYRVDAPTSARLVIRQPAARIPGDEAISSLIVNLAP